MPAFWDKLTRGLKTFWNRLTALLKAFWAEAKATMKGLNAYQKKGLITLGLIMLFLSGMAIGGIGAAQSRAANQQAEADIEALREELAAAAVQEDALTKQLDDQEQVLAGVRGLLEVREADAAALEEKLAAIQKALDEANTEIVRLQQESSELNSAVSQAQAAASASAAASAAAAEGQRQVWVSRGDTVYHSTEDCDALRRPRGMTEAEALDRGYTRCGECW